MPGLPKTKTTLVERQIVAAMTLVKQQLSAVRETYEFSEVGNGEPLLLPIAARYFAIAPWVSVGSPSAWTVKLEVSLQDGLWNELFVVTEADTQGEIVSNLDAPTLATYVRATCTVLENTPATITVPVVAAP